MENLSTEAQKVNGSAGFDVDESGGVPPHVPASIDQVVAWVEGQIKKHDMGAASGRVRITALRQMHEQVAEGEPDDARSVHDSMERLRARWALANQGSKSGTAQTYASRAKATIREFFKWRAAPAKYDPRRAEPGDDSPKTTRTKPAANKSKAAAPPVTQLPLQPQQPPVQPRNDMRTFPLGDGREIAYVLPPDGVKLAEVMKFAVHLAMMTPDFDITDPEQRQMFGLAVRRD